MPGPACLDPVATWCGWRRNLTLCLFTVPILLNTVCGVHVCAYVLARVCVHVCVCVYAHCNASLLMCTCGGLWCAACSVVCGVWCLAYHVFRSCVCAVFPRACSCCLQSHGHMLCTQHTFSRKRILLVTHTLIELCLSPGKLLCVPCPLCC